MNQITPIPILIPVDFSDDDDDLEFQEYNTVSAYFDKEESAVIKIISYAFIGLLIFIVGAAFLASTVYAFFKIMDILTAYTINWTDPYLFISIGIYAFWVIAAVVFIGYTSSDTRTRQQPSLDDRKAKQNEILDRLLNKDITKRTAMDDLNKLYTVEAIRLVEDIKHDRGMV